MTDDLWSAVGFILMAASGPVKNTARWELIRGVLPLMDFQTTLLIWNALHQGWLEIKCVLSRRVEEVSPPRHPDSALIQ